MSFADDAPRSNVSAVCFVRSNAGKERRFFAPSNGDFQKSSRRALLYAPLVCPAPPTRPQRALQYTLRVQEGQRGGLWVVLVRNTTPMTCTKRQASKHACLSRRPSSPSHPHSTSRHLRTPTGPSRESNLRAGQLRYYVEQGKVGERGARGESEGWNEALEAWTGCVHQAEMLLLLMILPYTQHTHSPFPSPLLSPLSNSSSNHG